MAKPEHRGDTPARTILPGLFSRRSFGRGIDASRLFPHQQKVPYVAYVLRHCEIDHQHGDGSEGDKNADQDDPDPRNHTVLIQRLHLAGGDKETDNDAGSYTDDQSQNDKNLFKAYPFIFAYFHMQSRLYQKDIDNIVAPSDGFCNKNIVFYSSRSR